MGICTFRDGIVSKFFYTSEVWNSSELYFMNGPVDKLDGLKARKKVWGGGGANAVRTMSTKISIFL